MRNSVWSITSDVPAYPRLERDLDVDVAVVGSGITGVTAAYLLHRAGKKVALLERDVVVSGDTRRTTAHLSAVTDLRLSELVESFGRDHARAVWDAGTAAIEQIHEIVHAESIRCDFRWVPGYLHAAYGGRVDERGRLTVEAAIARDLGIDSRYVESAPVVLRPAVRFEHQAEFHPLKYCAALLEVLAREGCAVHEDSEVTGFESNPTRLTIGDRCLVRCESVVIATHVPVVGNAGLIESSMFQTKLAPYTSYAISARLGKRDVEPALFWDTSDPYYYLRIDEHDDERFAIVGGRDHKTGQDDSPERRVGELRELMERIFPGAAVDSAWSGQVVETHDGLPYMGETAKGQFAATGFGGNGMTFGTVAAMMARDRAMGRSNPWEKLFDVGRTAIRAGAWDYVKENADYPYYLVKDRLLLNEGASLDELKPGEGKVLSLDGRRTAAYRDRDGKVTTLSPSCTHLGCFVHWNTVECTWECPCHGSRFQPTGEVIAGPAEKSLEIIERPVDTSAQVEVSDELEGLVGTRA